MMHSRSSEFATEIAILLANIEKEVKQNNQFYEEEKKEKEASKLDPFRNLVDTNY